MTAASETPVILALTVGGSAPPLERAICDVTPVPSHLLLVASAAEGESASSRLVAETVGRATLGDGLFEIVEVPPDNPDVIFDRVLAALRALAERFPDHRIVADYTGGSKSMSGGLLLAALQLGIEVQVTTGQRPDLKQVRDGTERVARLQTRRIRLERELEIAVSLGARHDYAGALQLIEDAPRGLSRGPEGSVSSGLWRRLDVAHRWAACLDAWDRFDHRGALRVFEKAAAEGDPWVQSLTAGEARERLQRLVKANTLTLCEDLLANARRRVERRRFDDALGRLYRCLEAGADHRLRVLGRPMESRPGERPPGLRDRMEALREAGDRLGAAYFATGARAPRWLTARHNSILAHGNEPVGQNAADAGLAWMRDYLLPTIGGRFPPAWPASPFQTPPGA